MPGSAQKSMHERKASANSLKPMNSQPEESKGDQALKQSSNFSTHETPKHLLVP